MDHIVITEKGLELQTKLIAGETTALFTKVCTSNAEYDYSALETLEELQNICQETNIFNVEVKDNSTVVISAPIDNSGLQKGYYMTVVGIYAKSVDAEEILYAVSRLDSAPYIPEVTSTLTGISLRFSLKVGNTENIAVEIDETTSLTVGEFNAYRIKTIKEYERLESQKVDWATYDSEITDLHNQDDDLRKMISSHKTSGDHDSRYYTEAEMDIKLSGKSDTSHTHAWSAIQDKPDTFTASAHTHDDRYYTEEEVNRGYYSLKDATEIPSGADLNSYAGFGNYVSTNAARSKTLKNCPWTDSGFKLIVARITGDTTGDYFEQRIIPNADECIEIIRHYVVGKGYTAWKRLIPGEYLPLTGGKLTGALNVGDKVNIRTDGEGGNIRLTSPQGAGWEMDAHDENFRLYRQYSNTIMGFTFTKEGRFIDGQGFQIPQIQRGSHTFNVGANSIAEQTVTFSKSFSSTPTVVAGIYSDTSNTNYGQLIAAVKNVTSKSFVLRVINRSPDALSPNVQWLAVL